MAKKKEQAEPAVVAEEMPADGVFEVITDRRPAWGMKRLEKGERFHAARDDAGLAIMLENGFAREVKSDADSA